MLSNHAQLILSYVRSGVRILGLSSYIGLNIEGSGGMWTLDRLGKKQLSLTCQDPVVLKEVIATVREQGHIVEEINEPYSIVITPVSI